jgi:hypothetical protein
VEGTRPLASVIIPAWNEERRMSTSLKQVAAFVQEQPETI